MRIGRYRHFKSDLYEVISVGHLVHGHNATEVPGDEVVIYRAMDTSKTFGPEHFWARAKSNFLELVEYEGQTVPRFEYLGDE